MSIGNARFSAQDGGGQVAISPANLSKAVVHIGGSPLLPENTLVKIGDPAAITSILDLGELAEIVDFTSRSGQDKWAICPTLSIPGAVGSVTHLGPGVGTMTVALAPHKPILFLCTVGGALGTAKFRVSLDGGVTYSDEILSVVTSWVWRVPGTYCTATFAAATYVATKTLTIGTDGTVTPGSGWVGTVTQTSSPTDVFELYATIINGGALGTATVRVSVDNDNTPEFQTLINATGIMVVPGTGLVLTFAGVQTAGDRFTCVAKPPSYSPTDINTALTVCRQDRTLLASLIHDSSMPNSAAVAFSRGATYQAALDAATLNDDKDWEAALDCPSAKGGIRIASARTGRKQLRGLSWLVVDRYMDTDPKDGLGKKEPKLRAYLTPGVKTIAGPGDIVIPSSAALYDTADTDSVIVGARGSDLKRCSVFVGGRDEKLTPALDDVQINTCRTYAGPLAVYLSVTKGIGGWKNLTTNAQWSDACSVRVLNVLVTSMRPFVESLMDQDADVNLDGTITEQQASLWDTFLNTEARRILGMDVGGDFAKRQASFLNVRIARTSLLGDGTVKRLDITFQLKAKGRVTDIAATMQFGGNPVTAAA